jgi:hypothetical protein
MCNKPGGVPQAAVGMVMEEVLLVGALGCDPIGFAQDRTGCDCGVNNDRVSETSE